MFIGHHAAALVNERFAPRVSLGTLFAASMWIDLVWPILLLLDIEHVEVQPGHTAYMPLNFISYPYTHSLVAVIGWSLLWGVGYYAFQKYLRGAVVVGLTVLSHWMLDLIVHRPDLPLWPGGPMVGFNVWDSPIATNLIEITLFTIGLVIYVRLTRPADRIGSWALWALVAFLAIMHVVLQVAPPPPSEKAVAWGAMIAWIFIPWGAWIDHHRECRT